MIIESYTLEELREHIRVHLGNRVWRLEGMGSLVPDTIDQAISGAVMLYSKRCPLMKWKSLQPVQGRSASFVLDDPGFGPFRVDFVEQNSAFGIAGTRYGLIKNLTGVAPAVHGDGVGADILTFLQWRKSFHRITSQEPQWQWDESTNTLWIFNPPKYQVCVFMWHPRSFDKIRLVHKDWVRRYAIAEAKVILGESRRKFQDSIQGPGGTQISLNGDSLVSEGTAEKEKLEQELRSIQPRIPPIWD